MLEFRGFMIRMSLNVKWQSTKKSRFSPKGQTTPKNLGCETLHIAHYEKLKICGFAV